MTRPLLEINALHLRFQGIVALDDVSFTLDEGNVTALIGPNGAGKTTMFNCVTGMYKPTEGAVRFDGEAITGLKAHHIARHGIARTFQNLALFSGLTVLQNLLVGAYLKGSSGLLQGMFRSAATRTEEAEAEARARGPVRSRRDRRLSRRRRIGLSLPRPRPACA
ncbi:ATP-binding cassette domain-containing protein [Mesorhizobium sp. YIM 152430]|uniref:ATP-binding cassette domain-containing protein n=1 Tax=Mesorhizobium sp. YIM 152430 TaxID=3031761 RepID=UPI0023DA613A|nr:ATP-binding cassette domain-containing protein [Mesorhizobium sp. YIM 152430]MDF1601875.1 ATP-binding cassette domain-containing protein [Mesorhizobium sp. YIM 152430]